MAKFKKKDIKQAKKSGNPADKMGKVFTKTQTGKKCYYSQLSYFETNDL